MIGEVENIDAIIKSRSKIIFGKIKKEYGPIDKINVNLLEFYILKEALSYIDDKILQAKARRIQYREYLQSPYWKIISAYLKYTRKQCKICKSTRSLTIHHRTYWHFGIEYKYLNDLDVICWACHIRTRKKERVIRDSRKIGEVIDDMLKEFKNGETIRR